jgi:hypothetical protein
VHRMLLAMAISPDNTPHGYNLTFAFPMLMFIIVSAALYLRFRSAHRVPGHVALASARWAGAKPGQPPAGDATLEAETSQTTASSSLQEGTAADEAEPESAEGSE